MSETDLSEENRRLRNEVERLQVSQTHSFTQMALRLQCMHLSQQQSQRAPRHVSPGSAPRMMIQNYETNSSTNRGIGSGLRSYTSQCKFQADDLASHYSSFSREDSGLRKNYLKRKYSELHAQDLPMPSRNTSFHISQHSQDQQQHSRYHLRDGSHDSYVRKVEVFDRQRGNSTANLLSTIGGNLDTSEGLTRSGSTSKLPLKFNATSRFERSQLLPERETSIQRKSREMMAVQRQAERQKERYRKISQMPLVR